MPLPRNTIDHIHYFCAEDTADKDAVKDNERKCVALYTAVSGGGGNDRVSGGNYGTFHGGEGDDSLFENVVSGNYPNATFNGGPGCDTVDNNNGEGTVDLGDQSGCPA